MDNNMQLLEEYKNELDSSLCLKQNLLKEEYENIHDGDNVNGDNVNGDNVNGDVIRTYSFDSLINDNNILEFVHKNLLTNNTTEDIENGNILKNKHIDTKDIEDAKNIREFLINTIIDILRNSDDTIIINKFDLIIDQIKKYILFNEAYLMLQLKIIFHKLIITYEMHNYKTLYDEIFNDKLYDYIDIEKQIKNVSESLTKERENQIIKEYNEEIEKLKKKNYNLKLKYEEGEIIGAKNVYDQWWMARVLKIVKIEATYIYYIEFLGWGKEFNELIYNPLKLAKFNKFKHNYYRKATAAQ